MITTHHLHGGRENFDILSHLSSSGGAAKKKKDLVQTNISTFKVCELLFSENRKIKTASGTLKPHFLLGQRLCFPDDVYGNASVEGR